MTNSKTTYSTVSRRLYFGLLASIAAVPVGCTNDGYPTDNTYHVQGKAPSAAPPPSTFVYRYPDIPPVLDVGGLRELVDQYRQRVVLLDFWATWSQTNREEMTMLARLQDELRDEGFQVIACSFDDPEKWSQTIVPIMHGARARFPCVIIPESNRMGVRNWLSPEWTYQVPARFVLNRQGDVMLAAMSDTPLASVEQQVREIVRHGGGQPIIRREELIARATGRGKVIDINTGSYASMPEIMQDSQEELAERMAVQISRKIDPGKNPRIAILPFPPGAGQHRADPYGERTAELVVEALKQKGFKDFIRPAQVERLIKRAGLTATTIEFNPTAAKEAIDCDYLVIGWVRQTRESDSSESMDEADDEMPRKSRVHRDESDGEEQDRSHVLGDFDDEGEPEE